MKKNYQSPVSECHVVEPDACLLNASNPYVTLDPLDPTGGDISEGW